MISCWTARPWACNRWPPIVQQEPGGSAQLSLALQSSLIGEVDVRLTQSEQAALAGSLRARLPQPEDA